ILDNASATALRKKLPASASVGNPIDVLGDADPKRYHLALSTALADDSVDAVLVILTPQAMTRPAETARAIAECSNSSKPILVSFMGGLDVESGRNRLVASNIPDYPSPERAINTLKAMYTYSIWRQRPLRIISRFAANRRRVERILTRDLNRGIYNIGEAEAKSVLTAYGFTVLPGKLACSADEAANFAEKIGLPIAMKIASPDIIHKSDVGGVVLNLSTLQQVKDAYDLMVLRIDQKFPDVKIDGVYIERMSAKGREVILGMNRDPQFGPMLMFGLGGIFVEVMKDVSFHIAPITEEDAMYMIENTRSIDLLKGVRGQEPFDLRAIATALQRMSQLVTDFPQIAEMDINPFMVGSAGQESVAVDARITLTK
ncbi:MAG: acetate--CoA ligase family protein, partial [Chitinispirillia bacterium]